MKKDFGYACNKIIKELELKDVSGGKGCSLDDINNKYFKHGEGSYLDFICYQSCLEDFIGIDIKNMLEFVNDIKNRYYILEDIDKLLKSDLITNSFKRIIMYNLYQKYVLTEYEKYLQLKSSIKDLLS